MARDHVELSPKAAVCTVAKFDHWFVVPARRKACTWMLFVGVEMRRLTLRVPFENPIASTPLSDEVGRLLVERYGPRAHPSQCVTLRCDELPSLVEVARQSDAVLLAIRAAAPALVELPLSPPLQGTARFGLVTLARRTEPPGLAILRELMSHRLLDAPGRIDG